LVVIYDWIVWWTICVHREFAVGEKMVSGIQFLISWIIVASMLTIVFTAQLDTQEFVVEEVQFKDGRSSLVTDIDGNKYHVVYDGRVPVIGQELEIHKCLFDRVYYTDDQYVQGVIVMSFVGLTIGLILCVVATIIIEEEMG
jgi:hypothetical protein